MAELNGRRVAVTGGGSGIGAATCRLLAARGARVWIGDRDEAAAQAVAESIRSAGGRAESLRLDVTDEGSFEEFLAAAEADGPLDALVNNAGVMWVGSFVDEGAASIQRQVAVNLVGPILGTRLAARRMLPRRSGHIVTVASAASKLSPAGEATYSATKYGIYGYLRAVRRELRGSGVELSVVMPAVVDTALAAGTTTGAAAMLTPERIAAAIADTLASPRFEVHVPRTVGLLHRLQTLSPQPVRDLLDRFLVPDQVRSADRAVRADYERGAVGDSDSPR
ncbi:SDR family oxidoreductase [Tsukamurella pseudospumae]|uniref:Short-chain dehydrogenase n=1 Tax=Tsukamurella pseudospumae TaxID=239498 RepID=A0A138A3I2_9ACTN|nr:SDR family oxidoreductase [Tsukamurella pseudospumae]KXO98672.1 short-chain dehydrogenase [Tsukamurella pseudospumae]KXP04992.1 short-chain dehydrogenase [Tsukamurella pseudospumae]